jgi:hypothetical protein
VTASTLPEGTGLGALAAAAAAVAFPSRTSFCWQGIEETVARAGPDSHARSRTALRNALARRLYHDFYTRGEPVPRRRLGVRRRSTPPPASTAAFEAALSAANRGRGSVETGWRIAALEGGLACVVRDGLAVYARAEELRAGPAAGPGDRGVTLALPKELLGVSPGSYVALGDRGLDPREPVLRIYWNVRASGAAALVSAVTGLLNRRAIPFRLKVASDPEGFGRCDAAVLYVRLRDARRLAPLVARIRGRVAPYLRPLTPVFAARVAPGVAVAEQPRGAESFGQHRCRLLAEGLVRAHEAGARSLAERVAFAARCFASEDVRVDAPHLNAGSPGIPGFRFPAGAEPVLVAGRGRRGTFPTASPAPPPFAPARRARSGSPTAPLDVAVAIGRRLLDDALLHAGRCTWIAWGAGGAGRPGGARRRAAALPPFLHGGAAGVALFLGELHAATGDRATRRTALAAMHHGLDGIRLRREARGLYAGDLGVALAAARVGARLGEPALVERAAAAVERRRRHEGSTGRGLDVVSGAAGDVAALLALAAELGDGRLVTDASRAGDELVSRLRTLLSGSRARAGLPAAPTGFAHGAAGAAWALLELFARTGDERYARAADLAFRDESRWFDEREGNWADLRRFGESPGRPPGVVGWCHGAGGIALSRLRAWELLGSRPLRREAEVALRTTAASLQADLESGAGDFSLCHGAAGLATTLLEGARVLGRDAASSRVVDQAAEAGLGVLARGEPWPCAAGGEHPGLITGLAGIGWFHLQLHDASLRSVLLIRPEARSPLTAARPA